MIDTLLLEKVFVNFSIISSERIFHSEDIAVVPTAKMSIGFTDEERGFTVKIGKDASMKNVIQYLK